VKKAALLAAGLCMAAPLHAQNVPGAPAPERVHVVRPGDTLWDIARMYLNDPFLWPEIFRLNPDLIRDPARIYPSERLRIPGEGAGPFAGEVRRDPERTIFFPQDTGPERETGPIIRAAGTADVPVLTPGDFFGAGLLAQEQEIAAVGRVEEVLSPSVVAAGTGPQIHLYDKIFVAVSNGRTVQVGDRMHLFREGRRVKPYGRVFTSTGLATVAAVDGGTATLVVVRMYDAIAPGDLAVPAARFPVPAGVLPQPAMGLDGEIIAFASRNPLQSTEDVVFVNLGEQAGVVEGDEFVAYLRPARKRGFTRPEVEVARLQAVRVTDRTASLRVSDLKYPALEPGMPIRRVAKMP
jgi:LysM repeat protein